MIQRRKLTRQDIGEQEAEEPTAIPTEAPIATQVPTPIEIPTPTPTEVPLSLITANNAVGVREVRQIQTTIGGFSLGMRIAPDGKSVAVFGFDGVIKIYDIESRERIASLVGHSGWGFGMAYSPDGTRMASGALDNRMFMWNLESERRLYNLVSDTGIIDLDFSPDGSKVVYVGLSNSRVFVVDADNGAVQSISGHNFVLSSVDISADGQYIVSGGAEGEAIISGLESFAQVARLNGASGLLWGTQFSPDGTMVASASGSGGMFVWNADDWEAPPLTWQAHDSSTFEIFGFTLSEFGSGANYLAWSPDSSLLVSVGNDGRVVLWDPQNGRELNSFSYSDGSVYKVDFSRDGSFFATLGGEGIVRIYGLP